MAAKKTKKTTKKKISALKPKTLNSGHAKNVKGGGWDVKTNTKA